jgi:hypothetical protein
LTWVVVRWSVMGESSEKRETRSEKKTNTWRG